MSYLYNGNVEGTAVMVSMSQIIVNYARLGMVNTHYNFTYTAAANRSTKAVRSIQSRMCMHVIHDHALDLIGAGLASAGILFIGVAAPGPGDVIAIMGWGVAMGSLMTSMNAIGAACYH